MSNFVHLGTNLTCLWPARKGTPLKGDLLLVPPERHARCGRRRRVLTWWTPQVSKQVKDQAKALLRKLHNMPPRCSVEGAVHFCISFCFLVSCFALFLLNQLVCQDPLSSALLSFGSAGAGEFVFHYTMDNGASALIMRLACQIIWRLLLSKIWVLTWNQDLIASGLKMVTGKPRCVLHVPFWQKMLGRINSRIEKSDSAFPMLQWLFQKNSFQATQKTWPSASWRTWFVNPVFVGRWELMVGSKKCRSIS